MDTIVKDRKILGTFKTYRGYTGSFGISYNAKEKLFLIINDSDIKLEATSNDIHELYLKYIKIIENYCSYGYGIFECKGDGPKSCNMEWCEKCLAREDKNIDLHNNKKHIGHCLYNEEMLCTKISKCDGSCEHIPSLVKIVLENINK